MNISEFYKYLNHPELLSQTTLKELEEVIERYPYFQAARMLYLKNLYQLNDDRFQATLSQTSAYIPDRKVLHNFIHGTTKENEPATTTATENTNALKSEIEVSTEIIEPKATVSFIEQQTEPNTDEVILSTEENKATTTIEHATSQTKASQSIADEILKKIEQINLNKTKPKESTIEQQITVDFKTKAEEKENFLSFEEWLDWLSRKDKKETTNDLIDQFLENASDISRIKAVPDSNQVDLTEQLLQPEEMEVISEQLARLYYQQGYFDKALKMYEKLFLKYPEKSIYFASLIQEIKQKLDKN